MNLSFSFYLNPHDRHSHGNCLLFVLRSLASTRLCLEGVQNKECGCELVWFIIVEQEIDQLNFVTSSQQNCDGYNLIGFG